MGNLTFSNLDWDTGVPKCRTTGVQKARAIEVKLPRSGSSWFTSLLNQLENVYLAKEIVQRKDKRKNQPSVVLSHLIKALAEPSSKIAFSSTSKYFSGRYWEDYILKGKSQKSLQVLGFTLNPEHIDPSMLTLSILNSYLSILTYLYVL